MEYEGRYSIFDQEAVKTYPVRERSNKVKLEDLLRPSDLNESIFDLPSESIDKIVTVAQEVVAARKDHRREKAASTSGITGRGVD